jgi:hypothetical protein
VAQKILDRDRPLRRHKLDASVAFDRDLRIGKGGHIFRERIGHPSSTSIIIATETIGFVIE